jgi:hypothetical protein
MRNPKFEIRTVFTAVLLLLGTTLFAQIDNQLISDRISLAPADSGKWGLSFSNFNYMRNTEYFNDIEVGRTLFGYQLNPSLFIQPNDHVKIQAGVFVQSDFGGSPSYTKVLPTFSVKINHNNTSFIFGTLEGALAHRMYEPLFDINSAIERRLENGFQLKHESKRTFFDLWINWEKFIERGSPHKEQFTAGINYTPVLGETESGFSASLPLQANAFHRGGQIDTDTSNLLMVFNAAAGITLKQTIANSFVKHISLDMAVFNFMENSHSGYLPYRNGKGFMWNLSTSSSNLTFMLSYWKGNDFISPRGTALYQSVSLDNPGLTQSNRQLIFVRFLYAKPLSDGLNLSARFEPFYDIKSAAIEYSYSLYISYQLSQNFGRLHPYK